MAATLRKNQTLQILNISNNNLKSSDIIPLLEALEEANKGIHTLKLRHNDIDFSGAKGITEALRENKSLTKVMVAYNKIDAKAATDIAVSFARNSTLKLLELTGNPVGEEGARALIDSLITNKNKTLAVLKLENCGIPPDIQLPPVETCKVTFIVEEKPVAKSSGCVVQ